MNLELFDFIEDTLSYFERKNPSYVYAQGRILETSVRCATNYISGALAAMLDLGKGSGPMNHAFAIDGEYHDLR